MSNVILYANNVANCIKSSKNSLGFDALGYERTFAKKNQKMINLWKHEVYG